MVISKNKLLVELINNQRNDVDLVRKLDIKDLHRICKYLNSSIFNKSDKCCLWGGYVTNITSSNTKYINFFFKKKKYALHRLLYENFIDQIDKSEYLRFSCENKGVCCNLNHIKKITRKNLKNKKKSEKQEKDIVIKKKTLKNKNLDKKKHIDKSYDNSIEIIKTKTKDESNKLIVIF